MGQAVQDLLIRKKMGKKNTCGCEEQGANKKRKNIRECEEEETAGFFGLVMEICRKAS